ncbi:MAG: PTS sugar transporter subunit IIA [Deferribacteres bacterium]|nr:PTS sugar transporter subunit IIA [candidate division KSB1 bacterium]MCB9509602.1 PTS sugar transporter subunit IIA [Deferribacteres bacterium]
MNLSDILSKETVVLPLRESKKTDIIKFLVQKLNETGKINNLDKVLKAVLDREAVMSTGVGEGVAIPHGKSDAAPNIVAALGIAEQPIDFDSIDKQPVQLIWLLVGPPGKTGPHLKALSRISRLMHRKDFRSRLIEAETPESVIKEIISEEENLFN